MIEPTGLDAPFQLLYTEPVASPSLPDAYRALYYSKPVSIHRAGDYIFLRTRCLYAGKTL